MTATAPGSRRDIDAQICGFRSVRFRATLELVSLILLVELIMWVVPFTTTPRLAYSYLAVLIALFLGASLAVEGVRLRDLGMRMDNFLAVFTRLLVPLGVFICILLAAGLVFDSIRFKARFFSMLLVVPPWALLQQYMLLAFANRRLRMIFPEGSLSVWATAAMFSLLHLPNPALTVACGFGGFIWAREYQRSPNLFAVAISHAIASAFLANSLPTWLLKNMVVGYNFFLR